MKILIVEDELELLSSMKEYLSMEGFVCEIAADYHTASQLISTYQYDCIIIDITLPDNNGLLLIDELKAINTETGIIIVSAKNSIDDRVSGLAKGSDDYLTKPFHLSELNARLKALIRRKYFNGSDIINCGSLRIDIATKKLFVKETEIILTQKEYEILIYLISGKEKVFTKEAIAEHLWGDSIDQADSFGFIYTHIKNLRRKITDAGGADPVKTVYGLGYKIVCE
ncbi:MAG: response regulator transcription factor [Bacteroidota bacterium]